MTEQEWLACDNSQKMLLFLRTKGGNRKLRLFGCACGRAIWNELVDNRSRQAIEVSELYADQLASAEELASAHAAGFRASEVLEEFCFTGAPPSAEAKWAAAEMAYEVASTQPSVNIIGWGLPNTVNCISLIRDIYGNPFRFVTLNQSWLTTNVVSLAQAIYDERRFEDMPILADALEDAGCTNQEVLAHARGEGPHVRGCWLVDLLLGKE